MRCWFIAIVATTSCCACSSSSPAAAPSEDAGTVAEAGEADRPMLLPGCPRDPGPAQADLDLESLTDPAGSPKKFTMEMALAGYPEIEGVLTALITTERGTIRCELDEARAPITVANFVGLARGVRPFSIAAGPWKVGRFYDGLTWHRVIPNFVIQGGDPLGNGTGNPGYVLPLENQVSEPLGTLAMAAATEPNASQFYIVVGKGPAAKYNVFGHCETAVAAAIAGEARDDKDKPVTDVHMQRIDIARCAR